MTMKRKVFIGILIVVVIVGGIVIHQRSNASQTAVRYVTAAVAKGTLVSSVSGSGNIIVDQTVKVSPTITGTVDNLGVNLGDQVKKGQTLFTISNDSLDVTVSKAYSTYLQAQQALVTAQGQVLTAQANYTNVLEDAGQAKARTGIDQANQQVLSAQNQLNEDQQTLNNTPSSAANYQVLQDKVPSDQAALKTAQDGQASANIAAQQANVMASATVQSAKDQLSAAETNVTIDQKNVDNSLADYNNQKTTADGRTVTAPIDGTITSLNVTNGDQIGTGGTVAGSSSSTTSGSSTPITISDLSSLKASVQINEVDATSVQVGQKVSMTFDAIDSLTSTGKVEKIDTVGTVTQGVVTYSATIDFDSIDSRIRPGMSVSATITTAVAQDVLTVPNSAVKSDNNGSYVQVMQNGTPVQQNVVTGATNDTDTEITSGLNEGDTIVTQTITPSATTASTASTSTRGLGILGGGGGGFTGGTRGGTGTTTRGN